MKGWITNIELRQTGEQSHEVAYSNALDAAEILLKAGYDVTLKPTLPDIPVGPVKNEEDDDE